MEHYKLHLLRLKTRLLSASSEIWDSVSYDEAKATTDAVIAFLVMMATGTLMNLFDYFPHINNLYAGLFYNIALVIGSYVFFYTIIMCCCVLRFTHRLVFANGWSLLAATDPSCLNLQEPLIKEDILV